MNVKLWHAVSDNQKRAAYYFGGQISQEHSENGRPLSNSDIINIWLPPASTEVSTVAAWKEYVSPCFEELSYFFNFNIKWFPRVEKHFNTVLQGSVMQKAKLNFLKVQRCLLQSKSALWSLANSVRSEDLLFAFHPNLRKHNWPGSILIRQREDLEKQATFRYIWPAYQMMS